MYTSCRESKGFTGYVKHTIPILFPNQSVFHGKKWTCGIVFILQCVSTSKTKYAEYILSVAMCMRLDTLSVFQDLGIMNLFGEGFDGCFF